MTAVGITCQVSRDDLKQVLDRSPVRDQPNAMDVLMECYRLSAIVWAGMVEGEPACLWGLIPPTLMSDQAYLWLLTTDLVEDHKFLFVRHSQRFVEIMLQQYPRIIGHCETSATQSIRWIKWLGGRFGEPEGKRIPFTIRKANG